MLAAYTMVKYSSTFTMGGSGLAMVSLYGLENDLLQEHSSQAVWACGALTGMLVVIEAKKVLCGVAMIPHVFQGLERAQLYHAYDKMGSDMAGLEDAGDDKIE